MPACSTVNFCFAGMFVWIGFLLSIHSLWGKSKICMAIRKENREVMELVKYIMSGTWDLFFFLSILILENIPSNCSGCLPLESGLHMSIDKWEKVNKDEKTPSTMTDFGVFILLLPPCVCHIPVPLSPHAFYKTWVIIICEQMQAGCRSAL